jgi:hypothetical protein
MRERTQIFGKPLLILSEHWRSRVDHYQCKHNKRLRWAADVRGDGPLQGPGCPTSLVIYSMHTLERMQQAQICDQCLRARRARHAHARVLDQQLHR